MSFEFRDKISPELARLAGRISDKRPILEAMGHQLEVIIIHAFKDPETRIAEWAPRKAGGTKPLLIKNGVLWRSFRTEVNGDSVTVGTGLVYAAIHQFGSPKQNIPARPFFPFATSSSPMAASAQKKIEAIARAKIKAMFPK